MRLALHTHACGCVVALEIDAGDVLTEQVVKLCGDHEVTR